MLNLTRHNQPLASIFDEFEKNINQFLPSYFKNDPSNNNVYWTPEIDIKEEDQFYVVTADMPGMEKKDIKINMDQYNNLVIEGERDTETKKEKKGYICFERYKGTFFRKFSLPGVVDAQGIKAKYQNGVLEINIPKSKETVTKQISIED